MNNEHRTSGMYCFSFFLNPQNKHWIINSDDIKHEN